MTFCVLIENKLDIPKGDGTGLELFTYLWSSQDRMRIIPSVY